MRQIVLDTETTGIGADLGHRIIEIGCIELVDRKLTGKHFHHYINPQREVDDGAYRVHGLSRAFLSDKPIFAVIMPEFLDFITGAELIIHNAPFDVGFLNAELRLAKCKDQITDKCAILDTLVLARKKHPGQRNGLDALCKRYYVENSHRKWHGALLDAELLALVYLAMTGGQSTMSFESDAHIADNDNKKSQVNTENHKVLTTTSPVYAANAEEISAHQNFIEFLVKKSGVNHWPEDILT